MPTLTLLQPWIEKNGLLTFHLASAGTTNATLIKSGPGQLYGWFIGNTNAAIRYLVFHDSNTIPIAGTGVWWKMTIPASGAANILNENRGIQFNSGLGITTVVNPADNDATAVAVNDLIINLFYR